MRFTRFEINLFLNIYLSLTLFFLIVSILINIPHVVFLFLFFVPLIFFIPKFSSLKVLFEVFILFALIIGAIFFTFRYFRSLFYPPKITEDKIVGYAQYFGYPLHFDTILFLIFLMIPVFIFFYILFRREDT